jgi:hypothetical protein
VAFTKVHSRHMRLRRGARTVILFHVVNGSGVPSMFEVLLVIRMRAKVRRGALFPWLVSVDFCSLFLLEKAGRYQIEADSAAECDSRCRNVKMTNLSGKIRESRVTRQ